MLRFALIYSCAMVVAGSSLLAELPEVPTKIPPQAVEAEPLPTPARKAEANQPSGVFYVDDGPLFFPDGPALMLPESVRLIEEYKAAQAAGDADFTPADEPAPSLAALRDKQLQLRQLQTEIAELAGKLGVAAGDLYKIQCMMAEVSLSELKKIAPELQWDDQRLSVWELLEQANEPQLLPTPQFRAIEQVLKTTRTMKLLASPTLVVDAYRTATVHSGGKFPVIVPAGGNRNEATWREFGVKFDAMVEPLGHDRIRVHVAPEVSKRDFKNAVKIDGLTIPGIQSQSVNFDADMRIGETILVRHLSQNEGKNSTILLTAITVTAVPPLEHVNDQPQLKPIPEDSEQK